MQVLEIIKAHPTQDGDGVKISRIHDFRDLTLDPFLMLDEIRSDEQSDFVGGFPPHPHRGIETFTYMIDGGFEHRDQMGNQRAIRAGDVQWMSTGYGVVHSEMPLVDESNRIHGFQIWLNMPASEKLRPARYEDSADLGPVEVHLESGAWLRALAGNWQVNGQAIRAQLQDLAAEGAIADVRLPAGETVEISPPENETLLLLIHSGRLAEPDLASGHLLRLEKTDCLTLKAGTEALGALVLSGQPISESIAHMGPFVMNTEQELRQAILDYQSGKFGNIE